MRGHRGCRSSSSLGGDFEVVLLHPMLPPARSVGGVPYLGPLRRGRNASCLRTAVFVFVVTFLWLQLHMANIGSSGAGLKQNGTTIVVQVTQPSTAMSKHGTDASAAGDAAAATQQLLKLVPPHLHKFLLGRNDSGNATDSTSRASQLPLNISQIQRSIATLNLQQRVHNEDSFGQLHNDSLVIVVQVHTRITYLRHLIVSLAQARGIENVLLVISHDHFDPELNDLVRSIDFCKVMQIFYPFSIQTHPAEFPGESPGDCPRNMKKEQALKVHCINAEHPDLYGHYREAQFTQTKHHWWWKANRVFDQLEVTRNHTGLVLFLEEDHYVAEDFIEMLQLMQRAAAANCEHCNLFSLGTYLKTYNYYGADAKSVYRFDPAEVALYNDDIKEAARAKRQGLSVANMPQSWNFQVLPTLYQSYQKAEVTPWVSSKHNMGMAFNRSVWREMRRCAEFFCTYDDYNWDWSLQHVSQGCMTQKLQAVVMRGPRVFHIGECGVHHRKNNCESTAAISKVHQVLKQAHKHLFPSHLTLTFPANPKKAKLRKGNGGWGDIRDHQLCLNMTRRSTSRHFTSAFHPR